jgi:hypothetical protein
MFSIRIPDEHSSTHASSNANVPTISSSPIKAPSPLAPISQFKSTIYPVEASEDPSAMKKLPRVAQYSVGLSRQPEMSRNDRTRAVPQPQKSRNDVDITHDRWSTIDDGLPQQLRVRLYQGPVKQPSNEGSPFTAPWPLWQGHGWGNMDQSPMELTIPDGPESLGTFGPAVSETWLTSLGNAESGRTGGLNGEWASSCHHL